ncbi:MAG: pyruvate formate lyase activating enzyme, partial [Bacteroidota bacterium]|nr:pyruvate formate lyase activating enzyme [Bacteroidota bacterium]
MKINKTDNSKRKFLGACALGLAGIACGGAGALAFQGGVPNKWKKEAYHYTKESGNKMYCDICWNECVILPGKRGDCRTKLNYDNKLYTLSYGNPCAINVDPVEKKPFYHYLPSIKCFSLAIAGCNYKCLNCQNYSISTANPDETQNYDLSPDAAVNSAVKYGCHAIAYTYSEPITFYEYMYDTAQIARSRGIKNTMVSNGSIKEKPLRQLCKYLDAATIDIKGFDDEVVKKLTGGSYKPVLKSFLIMKEMGVWLEISNLVVPSWTDNLDKIKEMCRWLHKNGFDDTPLHFLRFNPLYKLSHLPPTPVSTLQKAKTIALDAGIKYVYIGNVPGESQDTI